MDGCLRVKFLRERMVSAPVVSNVGHKENRGTPSMKSWYEDNRCAREFRALLIWVCFVEICGRSMGSAAAALTWREAAGHDGYSSIGGAASTGFGRRVIGLRLCHAAGIARPGRPRDI
jgi:hypothetical protein